MGIFNENAIIGTSAAAGGGGYDIPYSCRFEKRTNTKLNRTFNHSTSYTVSCWVKRCNMSFTIGSFLQYIYRFGANDHLGFNGTDLLSLERYPSAGLYTNRYMRDPAAWYHFVTKASTNNVQLFVNGVEHDYTDGGTYTNQTVAGQARTGQSFNLGAHESATDKNFDGYIAEFHFCDGMTLDPDSFGEFGDYGEWKPIEYADAGATSHGSNGFHLDFADNTAFGNDVSGNNNDLTQTNLAAHDQMTDTPTNNFCVLNVINQSPTAGVEMHQGNLRLVGNSGGTYQLGRNGTLHTKNKTYYEIYIEATPGTNSTIMEFGFAPEDYNPSRTIGNDYLSSRPGHTATTGSNQNFENHGVCVDRSYSLCYYDGTGGNAVLVTTFAVGDILQVAFDPVSGKFWYGLNNTWFGTGHASNGNPATGANPLATLVNLDHTWTPNVGCYYATGIMRLNFGQDGTFNGAKTAGGNSDENDYGNFFYPVPAGFLALCSKNMTKPAVIPSEHFNAVPYSGNGSTQSITSGFEPDLAWIKCRTSGHSGDITDSVRGATKRLRPEDNSVEATDSAGLTAFNSSGYALGSSNSYNASGQTYISWNWKAGGAPTVDNSAAAGATPTAGSVKIDGSNYGLGLAGTIAATRISTNTTAGFSIVSYPGNGSAGATVAHGLSKKPDIVLVKRRTSADSWMVGSKLYNSGAAAVPTPSTDFTDYLVLDTTAAVGDDVSKWNDTTPTASVFSLGTNYEVNASGHTYIAYCFHSVEGYSSIGWYWGNANADGVFQYTGFRPEFIMMKRIDGAGGWNIHDAERNASGVDGSGRNRGGNLSYIRLEANAGGAESSSSSNYMDILSNGFKHRTTDDQQNGTNDYLYMAFANVPSKYGNAN